MTFDDKLKQALGELFEERVEQSLSDTKKHRFSLAYRIWEHNTLKAVGNNHLKPRELKKVRRNVFAAAAAAVMLIGATVYASVAIGRYGFVTKPDYSKLLIENHPSDKTCIEEYYGLPEEDGWEIIDFQEMLDFDEIVTFSLIIYKNGEKRVTFEQMIIHEGNMGHINTEKADIEMLSLYSENDGFVLEIRKDWSGIFWIYDGYLFEISGNIDKNEAINLALSTKIVDLPKKS